MVVLPYKDSLVLFSKYLQQLIMESIGKAEDLDGNTVNVHRDDGLGLHRGSSQIALVIYSVIENRHLTVLSLAVRSLRGSCPVR